MNCVSRNDATPTPQGTPRFTAVVEKRAHGVVVRVEGEIDSLTVDRFAEAMHTDTGGLPLVVDLRRVGFLGSVGMAALVAARERTDAGGPGIRLVVGDNRVVSRPMTITGLLGAFAVFADADQACRPS